MFFHTFPLDSSTIQYKRHYNQISFTKTESKKLTNNKASARAWFMVKWIKCDTAHRRVHRQVVGVLHGV